MGTKFYTISKKDLFDLFSRLAQDNNVVVPYTRGEHFHFGAFDPAKEDAIELGGIRQSQPVKSFISTPRETVTGAAKSARSLILAGVKGCDLSSFILQDFVFQEGDFKDPFYIKNRQNTTIIASDCTFAKETCFCVAMGGAPYPVKYFDMNLSPVGDRFLVEVATEKAGAIVEGYRMFFRDPSGDEAAERDRSREAVSSKIRDFIARRGTKDIDAIRGAVKKSYNLLELWQDSSSTCVECGACNLACPTCHCFLLFDEASGNEAKRRRIWDSCLYNTFARVAGGANPRKQLHERLRNRFDKKFEFFPQVLNYFACTGCGRCIEACPGDIDLREVLKGAVDGKWEKPPHE